MQEMTIPAAIPNSIEHKLNEFGQDCFYLIFGKEDKDQINPEVIGNMAVGVVYNPEMDRLQYVPTIVPLRYDALFFFNQTTSLRVLRKR